MGRNERSECVPSNISVRMRRVDLYHFLEYRNK